MKTKILSILAAILLLSSCQKSDEQKFEKAITKYNRKQDQKSTKLINDKFLLETKAVPFQKDENYISGINSIIIKKGDVTRIITSDAMVEEWGQEILFSHYLPVEKRLLISDGISAELYQFSLNEKGEQQITQMGEFRVADSEKSKITTMFLDGSTLYFVKKFTLYSLDTITRKTRSLLGKELISPVKATDARVSLRVWPGVITISIGNGGSYNLYVIRASSNPSVIKQISLPSPFVSYNGESILIITGKTGHWKLSRMDIVSGNVKELRDFPELRDIRTSGSMVFFIEGTALHVTDSGFEKEFEPNSAYSIIDKTDAHLIVTGEKGLFAVSTDDFFHTTERYKELLPGFFENTAVKKE